MNKNETIEPITESYKDKKKDKDQDKDQNKDQNKDYPLVQINKLMDNNYLKVDTIKEVATLFFDKFNKIILKEENLILIKKYVMPYPLIFISWLLFPNYYPYSVGLLLLGDTINVLDKNSNQNSLKKIGLFIPWLLFNNIFNYLPFGSIINLIFTLVLFTHNEIQDILAKNIVKLWNELLKNEHFKKYLYLFKND